LLAKRLTEGTSNLAGILGRIPGLSPEELDGDTHGGAIETSMMLHLIGKFVDPRFKHADWRTIDRKLVAQGLEARASKPGKASIPKLLAGFKASLKYFEEETYSGKPSIATPEIGARIIEVLAGHSAETLSQLWQRQIKAEDCHSPVWPLKRVFLSRTVSWAFERAVRYRNPIF
jgi:creatinine amidohydrolase/Fe(II)-dependent formamide hydrolase-like protein